MTDLSVLYRDDATLDEQVDAVQFLIDTGAAWTMGGSDIGRTAEQMIEEGHCVLGKTSHRGAYGNIIPSRYEIAPGYLGSIEYARQLQPERWALAEG